MKYTFTALALAAVSAAVPTTGPSPPAFRIKNVISGGTGCPQGSVDIDWTNSGILPFYFGPEFTARVGGNAELTDSRKNCQLNIALEYSPGFSFAIFNADYTGFFAADPGVTGTVKSNYYFSGETDQSSAALTLQGPYYGRYTKNDDLAVAVWSPCGGDAALNVNSQVALTPFVGNANGILTSNKQSGRFNNNVYIRWRQC